jgi:hypothetical protein
VPSDDRHWLVDDTTSLFTLVTTTAPDQERIAGTTSEDVLPDCVGPTIKSELRESSRTVGP